jgi:hypothetical protein
MMLPLLQIAVIAAVAYYLYHWHSAVRRRNAQTWDDLLAALRSDWSARELSERFLWKEGVDASPDEAWRRMEGPRGLWVMFKNAKVMMEMADFAAKHCEGVDPVLVSTLHSDALQIRVCVLAALAQYALTAAGEGVRVNAFRAAQMYTGMAARTTQLLQDHAAGLVPDFVAAM